VTFCRLDGLFHRESDSGHNGAVIAWEYAVRCIQKNCQLRRHPCSLVDISNGRAGPKGQKATAATPRRRLPRLVGCHGWLAATAGRLGGFSHAWAQSCAARLVIHVNRQIPSRVVAVPPPAEVDDPYVVSWRRLHGPLDHHERKQLRVPWTVGSRRFLIITQLRSKRSAARLPISIA
jgi:hypothetical protein